MDIKRLPPSILVALGLAGCGPQIDPDDDSAGDATGSSSTSEGSSNDVSTSACLDFDPDSTGGYTTGPCLGQATTTGPCLAPEVTTSGSESGSGSDTETGGSGSSGPGEDSGGDGTTMGPCLAPPGDAPDPGVVPKAAASASARADILERLRASGVLPPDIAAKLEA